MELWVTSGGLLSNLPLLFEWRWVWLGPANAASSILGQKNISLMWSISSHVGKIDEDCTLPRIIVGRMWTCTRLRLRKRNGFIVWTFVACYHVINVTVLHPICLQDPLGRWRFTLWISPLPNGWEAGTKNRTPEIEDEEMEIGLCFRCDLNPTSTWCLYKWQKVSMISRKL